MLALLALATLQEAPHRFLPPAPLLFDARALNAKGGHLAPCVADVDGDGKPDLVYGDFVGAVWFVPAATPSRPRLLAEGLGIKGGCCIGSAPRMVDLDGDGVLDLVSGSYQQGVLWFRGRGKSTFEAPQTLVPVSHGAALAPALADWDGDGDLDLVVGTQLGDVLLFMNEGAREFKLVGKLTTDSGPIQAHHGGPELFDLDKDGLLDLILGDAGGGLLAYRCKERGGTEFATGKSLLPAFPRGPRPGVNLKPFVYDWNQDGRPDLLIGDFRPDASPVVPLTLEAERTVEALTVASSSLAYQIFMRSGELEEHAKKEAGVTDLNKATPEQKARYEKALARLTASDKKLAELQAEKAATDSKLQAAKAQDPVEGTLWILYGF